VDTISQNSVLDPLPVLNVIDDGTTIIDPGPPPEFSQYIADLIETRIDRERGLIMDDGYGIGGALGYRVHPRLRVEGEFSYRENEARAWFVEETETTTVTRFGSPDLTNGTVIDRNVVTTRTEEAATGGVCSYSGMFNVVYDFSNPRIRCCNLYLGGGLGLSYFDGDVLTASEAFSLDSTSFAYQLLAGVNVPLGDYVELFADYRFLGASRISLDSVTNNVSLGQFDDIGTHNVFVGVRLYPRR
jgi:opacity protein-like surface antigen